ncbi:MAG: iron complex outermembrane receptor protein [Zhongshania sp.]|jgi:iron complex outermembrane receptor protein
MIDGRKEQNMKRISPLLLTFCFIAPAIAAPVLEEVLVTAQKRSESLQDVPVAVSALSAGDLQESGFRDISDVSALVPSLYILTTDQPMSTAVRIRGIGNAANVPTFEPAVALYIDGAFRSRSGIGLGDIVDVQSIEVLKGPQSTLYGKNASAGLIAVSSARPSRELETMLEFTYASDDLHQVKGYLSGPLSERLAGRLSGSTTRRENLTKNISGPDSGDLDDIALRGQLQYDFSDRWTARLIAGWLDRDMNAMAADVYYSERTREMISQAGYDISNNDPLDHVVEHNLKPIIKQDSSDAILNVQYSGESYSFTSISSYDIYDSKKYMYNVELMPINIASNFDKHAGESISQEFRIASEGSDSLRWMTGVYYYYNDFQRGDWDKPFLRMEDQVEEYGTIVAQYFVGAAVPLPVPLPVQIPILGVEGDEGYYRADQQTTSYGIFAQADFDLSEKWNLSLGLRYSDEEKQGYIATYNTAQNGCSAPFDTNPVCSVAPNVDPYSADDSWSATTGKASLSYFPTPDIMLYLTYSTGFKAGGYNLESGTVPEELRTFEPEDVQNFELGWKAEFWDQRARLNGAIFHTVYDGQQNASFIGLSFVVNSAEQVIMDGAEIEALLLLSDRFTASISATVLDVVYESYDGGQCYYGREPDNEYGQCDLSGEKLPFTPSLAANASLRYTQPLFGGDLYSRLAYRYQGSTAYIPDLDPRHYEPAYGIIDARLGWRGSNVDVAVWGKNLSDEQYASAIGPATFHAVFDANVGSSEGSYQTFLGDPRSVGISLRLNY